MSLISFKDLSVITGIKDAAELSAALANQGVKFLRGKKGEPFTTLEAINAALGLTTTTQPKKPTIEIK